MLSARFPARVTIPEDIPLAFCGDALRKLPAGIGPSYASWNEVAADLPDDMAGRMPDGPTRPSEAPWPSSARTPGDIRVTKPRASWGYCTA